MIVGLFLPRMSTTIIPIGTQVNGELTFGWYHSGFRVSGGATKPHPPQKAIYLTMNGQKPFGLIHSSSCLFLQTQSERWGFRGFGSKGTWDFVHVMRMQMHQSAVSRLTWSLQLNLADLWWLSFVVARHAHILAFRSADRRC